MRSHATCLSLGTKESLDDSLLSLRTLHLSKALEMESSTKTSLVLSTPSEDFELDSDQISYQDERSRSEAKAAHASKAFGFPFNPYSIQIDLMRSVFRCIEDGKVGIFESPTGTVSNLRFVKESEKLDQTTT